MKLAIHIEYCGGWGYASRANSLKKAILSKVPDCEVTSKTGRRSSFEVTSNGTLVFSKVTIISMFWNQSFFSSSHHNFDFNFLVGVKRVPSWRWSCPNPNSCTTRWNAYSSEKYEKSLLHHVKCSYCTSACTSDAPLCALPPQKLSLLFIKLLIPFRIILIFIPPSQWNKSAIIKQNTVWINEGFLQIEISTKITSENIVRWSFWFWNAEFIRINNCLLSRL